MPFSDQLIWGQNKTIHKKIILRKTRLFQVSILNANYMAKRLEGHYKTLFTNDLGYVAHEFISDVRSFPGATHIGVMDIAKRLQDYGMYDEAVVLLSYLEIGTINHEICCTLFILQFKQYRPHEKPLISDKQ